jgi:hypothetical protein
VAPYVRHRQPALRLAAARALAKTGGPDAVAALRGALRGSDVRLRREAAQGLSGLSAKEAVADLFAVLNKEVPEAAAAVGVLCVPADCRKLVELLGKLPFDVMPSATCTESSPDNSAENIMSPNIMVAASRNCATSTASTILMKFIARSFPPSA